MVAAASLIRNAGPNAQCCGSAAGIAGPPPARGWSFTEPSLVLGSSSDISLWSSTVTSSWSGGGLSPHRGSAAGRHRPTSGTTQPWAPDTQPCRCNEIAKAALPRSLPRSKHRPVRVPPGFRLDPQLQDPLSTDGRYGARKPSKRLDCYRLSDSSRNTQINQARPQPMFQAAQGPASASAVTHPSAPEPQPAGVGLQLHG